MLLYGIDFEDDEYTYGGRAALARLTAAKRAEAELAAKLAVIDTIQIAA